MLSSGQVVNGRYRIVRLIAQGGFGAVYRAWDINMERPRALKLNLETNPEAQRQFKREAQILGDLTHPNLTKVIDHFVIPEQGQYLVMEFVEGRDLEEIISSGQRVPEAQALDWIIQICNALAYLHRQSPPVIHRDVKPANIKVRDDGRAVLVDFGIAKVYNPKMKTTWGARAITPGFSPQEQYGLGATDARTDVYALGATLYALLAGQDPVESVQRNLNVEMTALRAIRPEISISTEAAVLKAMEMLPERRFQTMEEFQAALYAARHQGGISQGVRVSPPPAVAAAAMGHAAPAAPVPATAPGTAEPRSHVPGAPPAAGKSSSYPAGGPGQHAAPHAGPDLPAATTEHVPWVLIAVHAAGLALVGAIQFINETTYYFMDNVVKYTGGAFCVLTCVLLLVDALVLRRTGSLLRRRFELTIGAFGCVVPVYTYILQRYDLAIQLVAMTLPVISLAMLFAAWKTRDWRVGVLGVMSSLISLQYFWLATDLWETISLTIVVFAGLFAVSGLTVLVNSLTRR